MWKSQYPEDLLNIVSIIWRHRPHNCTSLRAAAESWSNRSPKDREQCNRILKIITEKNTS